MPEIDGNRLPDGSCLSRYRHILVPLCIFVVCLTVYSVLNMHFVKKNRDPERAATFMTDGDEPSYLVMTESLISDHDLSVLNNYFNQCYVRHGYYPGELRFTHKWDTTVLFMEKGRNGRMVLNHYPFISFVLVPGFALFGYAGATGTMILLMSLAAMLVFLILRRICRESTAILATLAFFMTYPIVTYSRLIYDCTIAIFLLSLAMWASLRLKESGRWWYALIAALPAALLIQLHVKYIAMFLTLPFLLWSCSTSRKRDLAIWAAPVALSFVVLLLQVSYLYGPDLVHGLTVSSGGGGFFEANPFWGIFGLYLDRSWGLFIFAPLYLAFLPGVPIARKAKDLGEWWVFLPLCIVLHTLVVGFFGKWSGDWSPVPRQLMPITPLLVICAALFYDRCRSKTARAVVGLLFVLQAALTVFALIHPRNVFAVCEAGAGNSFIPKILGFNIVSKTIIRIFPLFHPVTFKTGILPLVAWLILLGAASVILRKRAMHPLYEGLGWYDKE